MTNTIITIGREFGSGGCEIGHKLAEKLGIKCYDKDMLDLAAKESGICQEIFESHDEKPTNSFLYSLEVKRALLMHCACKPRDNEPKMLEKITRDIGKGNIKDE